MSDEAQDTPVAATKSLFGALAFIFLLLGAEMITEKDGTRWISGVALIGCGIVSTYAAVFWNFVRTKLPRGFNAKGEQLQEIDRQNIEWTFAMPLEKRQTGQKERKICEPSSGLFLIPNVTGGISTTTPRCESVEVPEFTDVPNWIVFLSFPKLIAAKRLTINAHGAT
jgi:hypothetical protein